MPRKPILVAIPRNLYCCVSPGGEIIYDDCMNVPALRMYFKRQLKVYRSIRERFERYLNVVNAIYDSLDTAQENRITWYTEHDFTEILTPSYCRDIVARFNPGETRRGWWHHAEATKYTEKFVIQLLTQIELAKQAIEYARQFITEHLCKPKSSVQLVVAKDAVRQYLAEDASNGAFGICL